MKFKLKKCKFSPLSETVGGEVMSDIPLFFTVSLCCRISDGGNNHSDGDTTAVNPFGLQYKYRIPMSDWAVYPTSATQTKLRSPTAGIPASVIWCTRRQITSLQGLLNPHVLNNISMPYHLVKDLED